ncbi:peptidylprolyl isomerase [Rivularia sp. UHCC 0363]|uniref:peptidylprolyl isomerase n=1 Tax=Rivularia sp. UHCC 0363 TaxID=3110244 RepID=UPI002B1FD5B8|nr:peptidylprolyl isomerase [Rivularia sp. UHCC 0363]MEA5598196.1 peptidylprolyl isomerase [Rivularia sp. UHCC 0363]
MNDSLNILEINHQIINSDELIPLLTSYQMLPQLLREMIIDKSISQWEDSTNIPINFTHEEINRVQAQFFKQQQITNAAQETAWLERHGMTKTQLTSLTTRKLRIEKFQQATWGHKLESYFLQRKKDLDRVVYSMLRTQDAGIIQELYFRIQADEHSFAQLAKTYSIGPEAHTNGIVGAVEMGTLHRSLAKQLQVSQPGQLWQPTRFGEYFVIIRLEKLLPAQLDVFMRQRLLRELFEVWLQDKIQQLPASERAWLVSKHTVEQIDRKTVA